MRILIILLLVCASSYGQIVDRFTPFPSSGTTEYYENRVGAADPVSSTSLTGWVGGTGTVSSTTEQARSGTTSLKHISLGGLDNNYFDFSSASNSDLPDFVGGETITVTGWVYAASGTDVRIKITGTSISATQTISFTADTWTEWTFTGVSVTSSGNFYVYTDDTTRGTYWDDIRIYE